MERYWLAVLVVTFLAFSSANGAAFLGPGEDLQSMLGAHYTYLYEADSSPIIAVCEFHSHLQEPTIAPTFSQQVRVRELFFCI